jgi:transposase-like protein
VAATAVVMAVGVNAQTSEREVLGLDVGPSEDGAFWTSFLRSLVARGLSGVKLVTSDSHRGLKSAVGAVLQEASWQSDGCISCATLARWFRRRPQRTVEQRSVPSSPSPMPRVPASSDVGSQRAFAPGS